MYNGGTTEVLQGYYGCAMGGGQQGHAEVALGSGGLAGGFGIRGGGGRGEMGRDLPLHPKGPIAGD